MSVLVAAAVLFPSPIVCYKVPVSVLVADLLFVSPIVCYKLFDLLGTSCLGLLALVLHTVAVAVDYAVVVAVAYDELEALAAERLPRSSD